MTKFFALFALALSSTAFAGADLTQNASAYRDQYAFDLIKMREIRQIVKSVPGALEFIEEHSVATPSTVTNGQYLVFAGCMPEICSLFGYIAIINLEDGGFLFVRTVKEPISERISVAEEKNEKGYEMSPANLPMNIYRQIRDFTSFNRN